MSKHRSLVYGSRLPQSFLDAIQEVLGTYASANFAVVKVSATQVRVVASTGNDQVGISINGKYRYVTANVTAAHPGGSAGTHDVYVTASDNSFTGGDPETDNTVYSFGLEIKTSGTPSTALYRKVATVDWDGSAITRVTQLVGVERLFVPQVLTTTQRDALALGSRYKGLVIYNTTTAQLEVNVGTDTTPSWSAVGASQTRGLVGDGFPGGPLDGARHTMVDSLTAPTYVWEFVYRSGISDSYKWECVGATALYGQSDAGANSAQGSGTWDKTVGPSVTAPRGGIYNVRVRGNSDGNAAAATTQIGAAVAGADPVTALTGTVTNIQGTSTDKKTQATLSGGATVVLAVKDADSSRRNAISARLIELVPVRCS